MARTETHGTTNEYTNYGCRCEPCTKANTKAHANYMSRKPKQVLLARLYQRELYWKSRYDLAWERKDQDMLVHAQQRRDAFTEEIARIKGDSEEG